MVAKVSRYGWIAGLGALALMAASNPARAVLDASAVFSVSGDVLTITLTNKGTAAASQSEVLTALLFNVSSNVVLTPVSAVVGPTSNLYMNNANVSGGGPGTDVGKEWEYLSSGIASQTDNKQNEGISSTGLGIFGNGNFAANGNNLDGSSYGLVNGEQAGPPDGLPNRVYINNQAVFQLNGATGLTADSFSNFAFVYGTAVGEGCIGDCGGGFVPEPAFYQSSALLGLGVLGLLRLRRRTTKVA